MTLERLKKHKTIPFLNTGATETPTWARIGKTSIFDLVLNAQVETNDFIEDEFPTDDVTRYKPELAQELQANKGDAVFDYVYNKFYNLPTGEDVKEDVLIIFDGNVGTTELPKFNAWKTRSTLILEHFDTVAEKIFFKLSISGIERGTATVSDTGVPTYTKN